MPEQTKSTKCPICQGPVTINDGVNIQCQQGHVVAIDYEQHKFGPVSKADIDKLLKANLPPAPAKE
jgi:hypothetical protein